MVKKYIISPGFVRSRSDGDQHYISAERLVRLYKVHPKECIIFRHKNDLRGYTEAYIKDLIWLKPRADGIYENI